MTEYVKQADAYKHAEMCAENIKAYWKARGYKVNVEIIRLAGSAMHGHCVTQITDKFTRTGYPPNLTNTYKAQASTQQIKALIHQDLHGAVIAA